MTKFNVSILTREQIEQRLSELDTLIFDEDDKKIKAPYFEEYRDLEQALWDINK